MQLSPILSPDGRPMFSAGGQAAWKTATHRGWVVSFEWVGGGKRTAPCMVIWPETNVFVRGEGAGMWCIGRRAIGEFVGFNALDKCTGGPSEHCWREAREALPVLGKDPNDTQALHSLVDTIVKFAPELAMMPVAPKIIRETQDNKPMWDVQSVDKCTGKVLDERAV